MKPEVVKKALNDSIQAIADYKWLYSVRPGKDNTRNRKFPFKKMISSILAFRGGTLNREIMDFFDAVHVCFAFFRKTVPPPIVEAMLMKYISPIRPGRKDTRKQTQKPAVSFTYRVA